MKKLFVWGVAAAVIAFLATVMRTMIRTVKHAGEFMKPIRR